MKIVFVVISIFLCVTFSGHGIVRTFRPSQKLAARDTLTWDVPAYSSDQIHRFRVATEGSWAMRWSEIDSANYWQITITPIHDPYADDTVDNTFLNINVLRIKNGHMVRNKTIPLSRNVSLDGDFNTLDVRQNNGRLWMRIGNLKKFASFDTVPYNEAPKPSKCKLIIGEKPARFKSMMLEYTRIEPPVAYPGTRAQLDAYFKASRDPVEGYWEALDKRYNTDYATLGGKYELAVVKSSAMKNAYDIYYISGAQVNPSAWEPLRLKGRMMVTSLLGQFDLMWLDAYGRQTQTDSYAICNGDGILTLAFPLVETEMRFRRPLR